jgi:hypothetical protein
MNSKKWFGALAVIVVMVFAITFASVYVGRRDKPKTAPEEVESESKVSLTFLTAPLNRQIAEIHDAERNRRETTDFWFQNDNPEALEVGLAQQRADVKIYLVPGEKTIPLLTLAAAEVGSCSLAQLPVVGVLPALRNLSLRRLEDNLTPTELKPNQNSVSVPAGAVGWVRLSWIVRQPGNARVGGLLWMGSRQNNHNPVGLLVRVQPALRAPANWSVGSTRVEELPQRFSFPCWSSTRLRFRVKARIRDGVASDPIVVGEPVPLSREEIRQLEAENNPEVDPQKPDPARDALRGKVLSGYRIPITVRPAYADGKQGMDLGLFERWVELSSDDEGVEPVRIHVRGRIGGELNANQEDEVTFGDFNRHSGVQRTLFLSSSEMGLHLEVDRERSASFVTVDLKEQPQEKGMDSRAWQLRIRIRPGQVSGHFPRREDTAYQDSAVYLKLRYDDRVKLPRKLRIPLSGTAVEGL